MRKQFFAAVEGAKERDEGCPTSGAWGGPVERCLSGGGAAVWGWGVLEKRLWGGGLELRPAIIHKRTMRWIVIAAR